MGAYTPLNSLKQCAALADQCLDRVIQVVNEIPNLHSPLNIQDATEFACDQLTQLRAMINDSCAAHAGEVAETYSDDRPVMSVVPYGESGDLFTYVWDADPDGPGNQPGTLPIPPILADDFGYRFVVVAPGIIEAVETPPSDKSHIAAAAGIATVAIAVVSGAAFYVASYSTEKLGKASGTICASAFIITYRNCRSPSTTTTGSAPSSAPSPPTFKRFRASCQPRPSTSSPTP